MLAAILDHVNTEQDVFLLYMYCCDDISSVQVQSRLLANIAIRISVRQVTAIATNDHTYMMGKTLPERLDVQHGSSPEQMLQYWMKYNCKNRYKSLSKVSSLMYFY